MKLKFLLLASASIIAFTSCDKAKKHVTTYVYAQDLEPDQFAKLYVDDKYEGDLQNSELTPILCEDSTLTQCIELELPYGKHDFRLEYKEEPNHCSGYIKVKSGSVSGGSSRGQHGAMSSFTNSDQSKMIVGMNVDSQHTESLSSCD